MNSPNGSTPAEVPAWLPACLDRMAIVSAHTREKLQALPGGVSSDIYRVELPTRTISVKRALPKLKVAADWRAPQARNRFEVGWLRAASRLLPQDNPAGRRVPAGPRCRGGVVGRSGVRCRVGAEPSGAERGGAAPVGDPFPRGSRVPPAGFFGPRPRGSRRGARRAHRGA